MSKNYRDLIIIKTKNISHSAIKKEEIKCTEINHIIDSPGHADFKRKKILAHETHFEA